MDSVGIGEAPDAAAFNDAGSHTLGHISERVGLNVPNMQAYGLGNIAPLKTVPPVENPKGSYTKLEEVSVGKDTMTGHWELMGLNIKTPFRVFPDGFPQDLLDKITEFSGRNIVCNKPYSGTAVIDDFGKHQMETGDLIVYTSAAPVLQIAAHEEIIPLEELYRICEYTREITKDDPYMIGRIIARPYVGTSGNFQRTSNRHDYALSPFGQTTLDFLKEKGYVSTDSDNLAIYISNIRNINRVIPYPQRDVEIFLALLDYAGTHKHTTTQVGHALLSISSSILLYISSKLLLKSIMWI